MHPNSTTGSSVLLRSPLFLRRLVQFAWMILWLPVLGYDYTYHDIDGDLGFDDFSTASVYFDLESAVPFGVQLDEISGGFAKTPSPELVTRPGVSAIALGEANGPRRYGWALSREWRGWRREVELEFSETTNQPIALGLPAEPRWLPKLKGSGYPVASPRTDEVQSGILRKFGQNEPSFNEGVPSLAVGVDGRLWGIGVRGGESGPVDNTLFSILADGSDYRPVAKWARESTSPAFWVATSREGIVFAHAPRVVNGVSTFYRHNPANGEVVDLSAKFSPQSVRGNSPLRQLIDGRLYGTTRQGFFRFNVDGTGLEAFFLDAGGLTGFDQGVVEGPMGWLFILAQTGGTNRNGGIVRCRPDGSEVTNVIQFSSDYRTAETRVPKSALFFGSDGNLYGTVPNPYGRRGVLYRIDPVGHFELIAELPYYSVCGPNGPFGGGWSCVYNRPDRTFTGGVIEGDDGLLYGLLGDRQGSSFPNAIFRLDKGAKAFRLVSQNSLLDWWSGSGPVTQLVKSADGTLFAGTRYGIVSYRPGQHGVRPVRLFGPSGADGFRPVGPILRDTAGNLIGVAEGGGLVDEGVIYSAREDGSAAAVLHAFTGSEGDVMKPSGFLALGGDGWLYGTSQQGDRHDFTPKLYRLNLTTGVFEVLVTLPGRYVGDQQPGCGIMKSSDGMIYCTTPLGGAAELGTVVRYDLAKRNLQVLHEFGGTAGDTWRAWPELLESRDGFIYGLVSGDGTNQLKADGLFRIGKDGTGYRVLARLSREDADLRINGGLTETSDGRLYAVRGLPDYLPTTNDAVMSEVIRFVKPTSADGQANTIIIFRNPTNSEPQLLPFGKLVETADGRLVGFGYGEGSLLYRVNPADDQLEVFARENVGSWTSAISGVDNWPDTKTGLIALPTGGVAVGFRGVNGGLIRRMFTTRYLPPLPLSELTMTFKYGVYGGGDISETAFRRAFRRFAVRNLPAWIHPSDALYGLFRGRPSGIGTTRVEVVATDGLWPAKLATNWVNLVVQPGPLELRGGARIAAAGSDEFGLMGSVVGLAEGEPITVTWQTPATASSPPGVYPIEPVLTDPEDRLRNYTVTTNLGSLKLVDPKVRPSVDSSGLVLNFPGIPGKKITVEQTDRIEQPVWVKTHGFTILSETPPTVTIPPDDAHPTRFVRVTME